MSHTFHLCSLATHYQISPFCLLSPPEGSMTPGFETSGVSFPALADLASYPVRGKNHFSRCADRNQLLRETANNKLHFPSTSQHFCR